MQADRLVDSARLDRGHLMWPAGEPRPPAEWCDPAALPAARAGGRGRGTTLVFDVDGRTLVLRRYRRGGMVQRLGERYLRLGLRRSRAWRELALLVRLHRAGLPVPRPVAARVEPAAPGSPFARQLLLTEYLPGTRTLAEILRGGRLDSEAWSRIGATIAHLHAAGVDHADLNAHNLLLEDTGAVHLIDFDRGRVHGAAGAWRERNLDRLRRSLDKLSGQEAGFGFAAQDWQSLRAGYCSVSESAST